MDPDSIDDLLDEMYPGDDDTARSTMCIGYALGELIRQVTRIADSLERTTRKPKPRNPTSAMEKHPITAAMGDLKAAADRLAEALRDPWDEE